jgi:hypothetical protein
MNFDDAITAHSQWKLRLKSVVDGTSRETLDPAVIAVDDKCALGQWIRGDAKAYEGLEEYRDLMAQHAQFHRCAAEVLKLALAGRKGEASAQLENTGEFTEASIRTISAIRKLRRKVEQAP